MLAVTKVWTQINSMIATLLLTVTVVLAIWRVPSVAIPFSRCFRQSPHIATLLAAGLGLQL